MAGAVNIPLGLSITELVNNFKTASSTVDSFTSDFKRQFDGLKGSADAPVGALNAINRQLTITKRQIGDLIAAGGPIPTELATKFSLLNGAVTAAKGAFNAPIQLAPYEALNQKLGETKTQIQNILASGGVVPDALTQKFKTLENEVSAVNRVFAVTAPPVGAYAALNQKLGETRTQIQDLRAQGLSVPTELTQRFKSLENEVDSVNRAFNRLPSQADKLRSIGSGLTAIGAPLSVLSAGIGYLGVASFKTYGEIDGIQRALTVTAGSTAEANRQFKEFVELAKLPGLGLEEVVGAGLQFETLGYKAQTAEKYVSEVGNAIALGGKGKAEFQSVITQFVQMSGKARVLAEDLKPIVTASPVIGKAIADMFGTVDSEQISKKLQAAGRTPKDFIEDLVNSLSKLDRVKGGPKNALENFGDGVKLAEFQVASAADKVFGLTGKIESLGNFIGSTAKGFSELNPKLQGTILGFVGVVTAVGPTILAIGGAINLWGSLTSATGALTVGLTGLKAAFAFLGGPIGIAAAAIAGLGIAAYSIYQFNDATKSSYSSAKLLAEANTSVAQSIAGETANLNALLVVARSEKNTKEDRQKAIAKINAISPDYLGGISLETINTAKATTALKEYVRTLELKAKAQFASTKLAEATGRLEEEKAKLPADRITALDRLGSAFGNIFTGKTFNQEQEKDLAKKALEKQNVAVSDAQKTVDFYRRSLELTVEAQNKMGIKTTIAPPINYLTSGGDSAIKQLRDQKKAAQEAVDSFKTLNPGKAVPAELLSNYQTLADRLKEATSQTKNYGKAVKDLKETNFGDVNSLKRLEKYLESTIQLANGKGVETQVKQLEAVREQIEKLDALTSKDRKLNITGINENLGQTVVKPTVPAALGIGLDPVVYAKTNVQVAAIVGNFEKIKSLNPGLFSATGISKFLSAAQMAGPSLDFVRNKIEEIKTTIATLTLNKKIVPDELVGQLKDLKKLLSDAMSGASAADAATNPGEQGDIDAQYIKKAQARIAAMKEQGVQVKQTAEEMALDMKSATESLKGKGVELLQAIGEGIGQGENPLKVALKTILGFLGDFMIRIGSAMILGGTLLSAAITAFPFLAPFIGIKGPAGIIAGGALVVGGGAVKGFAGSFEGGGLFKGESFIRVGESQRAIAGGGEFVAPVALGADLISARIVKNIGAPRINTESSQRTGRPNVAVRVSGKFELRKGDLAASIDDYHITNQSFT